MGRHAGRQIRGPISEANQAVLSQALPTDNPEKSACDFIPPSRFGKPGFNAATKKTKTGDLQHSETLSLLFNRKPI